MSFTPSRIFFTKGVGRHEDHLVSFELALRDARIETCNLVAVSSILPAGCERIPVDEGAGLVAPGSITFAVMARSATNEPHRLIAASIGVAQPADEEHYGYLSEHHSYGQTEQIAGEYAEDLAATMLATKLGIAFDPAAAWDEREDVYRASGRIIRTFNVTQSAVGDKNGDWTTVLSAAVLLP